MDYKRTIKKLEKDFSETNMRYEECLSEETRQKINKNYNSNQKRRMVDVILNEVKNKDSVKTEVHQIVKENNLNELCANCRTEQLIAIIILYCFKIRDSQYRIERSRLWREYEVTWQKYSIVISRLLQKSRENSKIKTDKKVDENLITW